MMVLCKAHADWVNNKKHNLTRPGALVQQRLIVASSSLPPIDFCVTQTDNCTQNNKLNRTLIGTQMKSMKFLYNFYLIHYTN